MLMLFFLDCTVRLKSNALLHYFTGKFDVIVGDHSLIPFAFDNGDMSSLKRHVFISLLFILNVSQNLTSLECFRYNIAIRYS